MKTRFILPLTLATVLHASVFFGAKWPHATPAMIPDSPSLPPNVVTISVDLDPPEKPDNRATHEAEQPKGRPDISRPTLSDETAPRPDAFEQVREASRPQPITVTSFVGSDVFGVPEGTGTEWSGVAVLPAAGLDNSPRTRSQVAPSYPAAERSAGITGDVWVEFVVGEEGRVQSAKVVKSSHAAFEPATLRAVEKWRFEPGKKNGRPVKFRMVVPVQFNLDT